MKKILLLMILGAVFCACESGGDDGYETFRVAVQLNYPAEGGAGTQAGVAVELRNIANGDVYPSQTDAGGLAAFDVPAGVYDASASETRSDGAEATIFNGTKSSVTVAGGWDSATPVVIELVASKGGSLVIKELYVGGCPTNDGASSYARDQYIILYNNSPVAIEAGGICLAVVNPYNGHGSNDDYVDGVLNYASQGWIPAGSGFWSFPEGVNPVLQPGEEMVIALNNAIDNTVTYANSVNFNDASYYATYDTEVFNNASYYTLPTTIPSSHWMKAHRISAGNVWVVSQMSPAIFIFEPEGKSVGEFTDEAASSTNESLNRKKLPVEWIIDGVEVFHAGSNANQKRLTPTVDAGYVYNTNKLGYTVYRNVDKDATEALAGNAGKLVYNYNLGTTTAIDRGSTDPSGIDAEASLANGARIIYKDTNNSSNDFHQRNKASLRK